MHGQGRGEAARSAHLRRARVRIEPSPPVVALVAGGAWTPGAGSKIPEALKRLLREVQRRGAEVFEQVLA